MTKTNDWKIWFKLILIAFIFAFFIRIFLYTPLVVSGASMQPTLYDGDKIIINKYSYAIGEPERFDIIVFHANKNENFIKRVIGLPGENIRYENEILYVNGQPIDEPFLNKRIAKLNPGSSYTNDFTLEGKVPGHYKKIPQGYVLVLGDNRTNSKDSRELGLVSYDKILGKAQFVYWPLGDFGFVK